MVSLVNFKSVDEELACNVGERVGESWPLSQGTINEVNQAKRTASSAPTDASEYEPKLHQQSYYAPQDALVARPQQQQRQQRTHQQQQQLQQQQQQQQHQRTAQTNHHQRRRYEMGELKHAESGQGVCEQADTSDKLCGSFGGCCCPELAARDRRLPFEVPASGKQAKIMQNKLSPTHNQEAHQIAPNHYNSNFTVTWRNLKFCIEPKWHERLAKSSSSFVALASRVSASRTPTPSTDAATNRNPIAEIDCAAQTPAQPPSPASMTRVVLDELDGSFRSGELTAILGPSGAGKTTLLDCLTGHRKAGLSGSIRFACSTVSPMPLNAAPSSACRPLAASSLSAPSSPNLSIAMSELVNSNCDGETLAAASNKQQPRPDGYCCYLTPTDDDNPTVTAAQNKQKNLNLAQTNPHPPRLANGKDSVVGSGAGKHCSSPLNGFCSCLHHPCSGRRLPQVQKCSLAANTGDNLKVSIIPQNDHLIGHLTVYETLNYASKMKNCFDAKFDHKFNVKRVAQQLGLVSCLGTRINKLSGGQYKRVSIAQELLSSPDVLILDEPTSGLDAMSCYQTVQVLKKLTHASDGQKHIAVILTIHQPNSDVFQQFNHVYVVAQGGKCIFEGPPANIESVVNRVGICLPSSYYNPATMIVEIAAGKFGQVAICKLNEIQKAQYNERSIRPLAADEQNSTGDSAVDCASTSPSCEDDDDDGDGDDNCIGGDENNVIDEHGNMQVGGALLKERVARKHFNGDGLDNKSDNHDNDPKTAVADAAKVTSSSEAEATCSCHTQIVDLMVGEGLVNEAFVMDATDQLERDSNNNSSGSAAQATCCSTPPGTKLPLQAQAGGEKQDRRKKRRRTRRRAAADPTSQHNGLECPKEESAHIKSRLFAVRILMGGDGGDDPNSDGDAGGGGGGGRAEKRLKLNSLKAGQRFPFWRHTYLHFHRSWLSIVRDPMLCGMQLALHIIVPVMVSLVYGTYVGKPNACPRAGPIDIMAYALEPTDSALQLQEDLRTTLENIGYIFFKLYGIIFAAMTVTVLTFPLDMHVLVKEFRNGWYGLSSYFLGRTLADIPFQLTLPLLAMSLSYYSTGQPYSYMQWRFFSITAILILSSLIAQSQGLLFGAILMDKMKAAVFVAPAATTPIILFAGFLVRTQSIPRYLRPLSNLSYLRYAIEACLISRYGFNQCECDPAIFNQTVPELPPIARSMLDYWLSSFKPPQVGLEAISSLSDGGNSSTSNALAATITSSETTTTSSSNEQLLETSKPDLFTKLIDSLARANSFGRNITSCEQVVPYPMIDYDLKDSQLFNCFAILLAMLIFTRLLTFFIVCFKVKRKV